ncbi:MAG: NTP transferase domain-containing protein [Fidelibacterota bacterium]|nr:MAG: NTP transferase domain-containing protein [Candidatus Neomarinimicrobiota bacterium]
MKLVIIAAGEGSRLRSLGQNIPKTLMSIGGQPVIEYIFDGCRQVGIPHCILVTGAQHEMIEDYLRDATPDLDIETVHNPEWRLPNGVSVLQAKPCIPEGEDFMISMSDHLYGPELLELVHNSSLEGRITNVGVDRNIERIFDLEDGMKITFDTSDHALITGMSKTLASFEAIDCGIFKCRYDFFRFLEAAMEHGRCSLADACNLLIASRELGSVDIGDHQWLDIDTPEAFSFAEENYARFVS